MYICLCIQSLQNGVDRIGAVLAVLMVHSFIHFTLLYVGTHGVTGLKYHSVNQVRSKSKPVDDTLFPNSDLE